MNLKHFFLILCFNVIVSLSANIITHEEFFDSLCTHPALAELDWNLITQETKENFYISLVKKALFTETDMQPMNIANPKKFFTDLYKLQKNCAHTYPQPSKQLLQQWLVYNDNIQNNINMSIQLLSINPQYASIFLTRPLTLTGKRLDHPFIILFALLAGGNPNYQGINSQNVLSQIISDYKEKYSEKSVELLLLAGANPNIQTGVLEETALHHAAYIKNRCIIHTLLEHGANPHLQNKKRQTPRDLITMSQRFPHTSLNSPTLSIREYFEKNQINNVESFKEYCKEIEEDFLVAETVFSIKKANDDFLVKKEIYMFR